MYFILVVQWDLDLSHWSLFYEFIMPEEPTVEILGWRREADFQSPWNMEAILMVPTWELTLIDSSSYKEDRRRGKGDATPLERQNLNRFMVFASSAVITEPSAWPPYMRSEVQYIMAYMISTSHLPHWARHASAARFRRWSNSKRPMDLGGCEAGRGGSQGAFWRPLSDGTQPDLSCKRSESAPWKKQSGSLYIHKAWQIIPLLHYMLYMCVKHV